MIYWKQEKWFKPAKVKPINNIQYQLCCLTGKNRIPTLKPNFGLFQNQVSQGHNPHAGGYATRHKLFYAPQIRGCPPC